jgi:hypothetical protein
VTIDATNRRSLWHFSLGSLLLLTAAIALLVWLYTQQWRLDELIFIVLWMACVVAGVVHSRRGGWGVSLSLIAGAILPVSGFLAYHLYLYFIRRMGVQTEAFYLITLQVTAYGTAFSAALVVAAVVLFDRQSPNARKRIKLAAGLALIGFAVLIVGLRIRHDQRSWHPILTLPIGGIDNASPAPPPIAFTPDGSLMAIVGPSPDGKAKQLRIWELATLTERPPFSLAEQVVSSICFAPDGKQIAVVRPDGISIYDTATGKLAKSINELTANPWIPRNCRYSPDGKLLALCRYDGKVYKALVWETANWTLLHDHEITNCIAQPAVADDELVLLKFNPGAYFDLAVVDLETLEPRHPPHSVHGAYRPVLSNDGLRVGLHFRILDLESGTSQELNGPVYCLARDGQLYATRRCDMKGHRMERSPDWRLGLPIVRHWWRTRHYSAQVVLIDIATQIELTSSPNYSGQWLIDICASDDGSVVAGIYEPDGVVRVWRVPD